MHNKLLIGLFIAMETFKSLPLNKQNALIFLTSDIYGASVAKM